MLISEMLVKEDASRKRYLEASLVLLAIRDVRQDEHVAIGDRNFDRLSELAKVSEAINIVLEYLDM